MTDLHVIDARTKPDEPICDFCSHPNPTRRLQCPSFPMDRTPGYPELRSGGDWLACSVCGAFIDADNWTGLLMRAVDRLHEKYQGIMPRRILTDTIKRSHDLFREHYKGKSNAEAERASKSDSA